MSGGEESPQKRKRSIDDVGDREGKKMHLEDDSRLGLMDLHLDVGPKYLLCKTRKALPEFLGLPLAALATRTWSSLVL